MVRNTRRYERYDVEVTAEVYEGGDVLLGATRNLSRGGVCIDLERAVPEGGGIQLSLFLTLDGIEDAEEEPLTAKATVMWCSERDAGGFAAGARFEGLTAPQQFVLDRFLAALGEKAAE